MSQVRTGVVQGETVFTTPDPSTEWRPRKAADPEQPPIFPIPDPQTPAAKQAKTLLDNWRRRAAHVAELRARVEERKAEVGELESQYHAEVQRSAERGIVSDDDAKLLDQIKAFGPELRDVHEPRLQAALRLAEDEAATYYAFLDSHARELLAEIEPEAHRIRDEYVREAEKVSERLRKLQGERGAIAEAVRHFTAGTPGIAQDIPDDPRELALPGA